ncbi:DNA repair protein RecO [Stappia sp.]|uniref:DNA repair protein RecO n=1 Tax=Stappia sp. TaxID=1870903 RepID=UPI0032D8DF0D
MEWSDEGIILATRRHGESSLILEVMTRARGRHLGLVRGGRSRRQQATLQPGNTVSLVWRARLDHHLGTFTAEAVTLRAADLMRAASGVYGLQAVAALLHLLPERDPHPQLHAGLETILAHLHAPDVAGPLMVHFELQVLADLGFGLDLSECAATGTTDDLVYVSPKSGRAVSRSAGLPYHDRMLPLPAFLNEASRASGRSSAGDVDPATLADAFRLTGFFLNRHVYEPRGLAPSPARDGFIEAVRRALTTPTEPPD